jgi:hypothetical protein
MRLRTKIFGSVVAGLAMIAVIVVYSLRHREAVKVKLWDGSEMRLIQTDHGSRLCYDGAAWQRLSYKALGITLPIRYKPTVIKAWYTNGIGLRFCHDVPFTAQHVWNGSGKMYCIATNGVEALAVVHVVNFNLDKREQNVVGEELWMEIPFTRERELHMRLYETNRYTGVVSTNDFRMANPAL